MAGDGLDAVINKFLRITSSSSITFSFFLFQAKDHDARETKYKERHKKNNLKKLKYFILDHKGGSTSQPTSWEPSLTAQCEILLNLARQNTQMSLPTEEIFFGSMLPPRRTLKLCMNKIYMDWWKMQTCVKHMFTRHKVVIRQEVTQSIMGEFRKTLKLMCLTIPRMQLNCWCDASPSKSSPINTGLATEH